MKPGILLAATVVLALASCTAWPEPGTGGMAEYAQAGHAPPPAADDGTAWTLIATIDRLRRLGQQGGLHRFPARIQVARRWAHRASRELAGGLVGDARLSIAVLRQRLDEIEKRLDREATQSAEGGAKRPETGEL